MYNYSFSLGSIFKALAGPHYPFSAVNQCMALSVKKPLFDVHLVGLKKKVKIDEGLYSVNTS